MNLIDYHVHTELCGHASGSMDDYIREAMAKGLREIGFSDHAPLPEGLREGITMLPEETEMYIESVEAKKREYKDDIDIRTGFEVDFPLTISLDRRYLADDRLDYLTGSCHFLGDWAFDHPDNIREFEKRDIDKVYAEYYEVIYNLADSGYFNIVGHIDLVKKFGHRAKADFTGILEKIAVSVAKNGNMAVEINTSGARKPVGEIYPSDDIIELFFRNNVPVTLGSDSHKPEEVAFLFGKTLEKIKQIGYRKISGFQRRRRYDIIF